MAIAFTIVSVLGMVVFFPVAWPVGVLFAGLTGVYVTDFFASVPLDLSGASRKAGEKGIGFFHLITGIWLMYLTFATTLNIASGYDLPGG